MPLCQGIPCRLRLLLVVSPVLTRSVFHRHPLCKKPLESWRCSYGLDTHGLEGTAMRCWHANLAIQQSGSCRSFLLLVLLLLLLFFNLAAEAFQQSDLLSA